jgi:hypothetical protein
MLRLINIRVNANKSLTIHNPIKIRQGDFNTVKLVIDTSLYLKDNFNVLGFISFKRPDNKQIEGIALKYEGNSAYSFVIRDPWLVDISGQLWFTINFDKISRVENGKLVVQERIYAGNTSLMIEPDANYTVGDYLPATNYEELNERMNTLSENINTNAENIDTKLNKDFTTYPKLDWETVEDTDLVVLNRVDSEGNVTQYNAEAKDLYNSVNNIFPNEDGNIDLNSSDIPYNNTNVETALNDRVKISDKVVYYEEIQDINEPFINVTRADYAVGDGNGNNIVDTYATIESVNSSISSINGEIDTLTMDVSDLNQNKQDNLSVNNSLNFSNNELSLNKNYTASELIFNGTINNTSSNASTMSNATFTPTHLLIIYNDYEITGGQIVDLNGRIRSSNCRLDSYEYGTGNNNYQQSYYDLNIVVNYNTRKIYGSSKWTTLYYSDNSGITGVNQSTNGINVKVYAINV